MSIEHCEQHLTYNSYSASPVNTNKLFRVHLEMHYSDEREQSVLLEKATTKNNNKNATRSSEEHVTSCNFTQIYRQ